MRIDKFVGNVQDKYSSKCIITGFDFHFDTQENNMDFAYYCIRYHLGYLLNVHTQTDETVTIGKGYGFHYHLQDTNEWYYFEAKIVDTITSYDVQDFLDNKVKFAISMTSSTKVIDEEDINLLNSSF